MKVVAFNGSPREKGNTFQSLTVVLDFSWTVVG